MMELLQPPEFEDLLAAFCMHMFLYNNNNNNNNNNDIEIVMMIVCIQLSAPYGAQGPDGFGGGHVPL
jgi:hypothetical protein